MRGSAIKRGRTWSYVVDVGRDPTTSRRRQKWKGGFATRGKAEDALARVISGVDRVDPPSALTFGGFLDQWLAGCAAALKPSTLKSYREVVRWYVQPRLGDVKLTDVNALMVRNLYAKLLAGGSVRRPGESLAPATVGVVHRVLRKACNDAVAFGLISRSPLVGMRTPRIEGAEMRTWTPENVRSFLESVADDRLYAMWVLVLSTGMRRGELAGLRSNDVDLDAKALAVLRTRVSVNWEVHTSDPKTRASRRRVSLDDRVVSVLRAHRRRQREERLAWGPAWIDSGYVFTREDGEPLHPERVTVLFRRLVHQAALPKIRLHDLRHTSASLALAAGVHPKVVSERLGHSSVGITLDLYSHVTPGLQIEAAEKLGAMIFGDC